MNQAESESPRDRIDHSGGHTRAPASTFERRSVVQVFEPARGGVPTHVALLAGGLISRGWRVTVVKPRGSARHGPSRCRRRPCSGSEDRSPAASKGLPHCPNAAQDLRGQLFDHPCSQHESGPAGGVDEPVQRCSVRLHPALLVVRSSALTARAGRIRRVRASNRSGPSAHNRRRRVRERAGLAPQHQGSHSDSGRLQRLPANPIDIDRDSARARLGIAMNGSSPAGSGATPRRKGPRICPFSARQLDRAGIGLVALGDGLAASPEAERIAAAGGIVLPDGSDPNLVYAAADVFVSTSAWEGHPVTVLEAMRAGLPVVAYAVGGIPEQVEESRTGYLVHPGSHHELAARVVSLSTCAPLRERMGAAGRVLQSRKFDLATMVDRIQDLYCQVLAGIVPEPGAKRYEVEVNAQSGAGTTRTRARHAQDARTRER